MKIFNWVHRKFHSKDERKSEAMASHDEMEKNILLKHVAFDNMVDSLGDGFLSIGTFGLEPFPNLSISTAIEAADEDEEYDHELAKEQVDYYSNSKELGDDDEKQEINPLVFSAYESQSQIEIVEMDLIKDEIILIPDISQQVLELDDNKLKKERITLADLFLAESDDEDHHVKTKQDCNKLKKKGRNYKDMDPNQVDGKKKFGKSFSKKLNLGSAGDPIKKVQGLMRKMIKKKIHPSIEDKIPKITEESVSLLLREVATA